MRPMNQSSEPFEPCDLILALDLKTRAHAIELLKRLGDNVCWVKIGLQMFTRYGPDIVKEIADQGYQIFLDLKLHDIPNTVANAIESLSAYPIGLLTLHCFGGAEMMQWAREARDRSNKDMKLLGVTVLTSMDRFSLAAIGIQDPLQDQVLRLARLAIEDGQLEGLVCSPQEVEILRAEIGSSPLLVTPGIRPVGSSVDEQKRIATPAEAVRRGATHIVVGRPILEAEDPARVARAILKEIQSAQ